VVASGARYRRPAIQNLPAFEGHGVWYWASPIEAKLCAGERVLIVGGGNSAGQAAVFLAGHAARVTLMVRGARLAASMSQYLIDRRRGSSACAGGRNLASRGRRRSGTSSFSPAPSLPPAFSSSAGWRAIAADS
jgi:cation diffusion facilitator CzcD-associated flavoprotein CzcO